MLERISFAWSSFNLLPPSTVFFLNFLLFIFKQGLKGRLLLLGSYMVGSHPVSRPSRASPGISTHRLHNTKKRKASTGDHCSWPQESELPRPQEHLSCLRSSPDKGMSGAFLKKWANPNSFLSQAGVGGYNCPLNNQEILANNIKMDQGLSSIHESMTKPNLL